MNIKQTAKKIKSKKIIIAVIGLVVVLVVLGGYLLIRAKQQESLDQGTDSKPVVNYGDASQDQQDNGTTIKGNSTNTESGEPNVSGSDQSHGDANVTITAANQNGTLLQIRTLISANVNTGTCTLVMEKGGQSTITQTADVQALAQDATCKGFDISIGDVAKGDWQVTITYQNDTLKGSTTQSITIQ